MLVDTCTGLMLYHHGEAETRSWVIDLVAKHKSGELRCPATALIINPANRAPGVHTGTAPGGSWVKHKKIFFFETTRSRAFIFCL